MQIIKAPAGAGAAKVIKFSWNKLYSNGLLFY